MGDTGDESGEDTLPHLPRGRMANPPLGADAVSMEDLVDVAVADDGYAGRHCPLPLPLALASHDDR